MRPRREKVGIMVHPDGRGRRVTRVVRRWWGGRMGARGVERRRGVVERGRGMKVGRLLGEG